METQPEALKLFFKNLEILAKTNLFKFQCTEYKVVASAIDLISMANHNQLEASLPYFDNKEINEGILSLIKYEELDEQAIIDLIHTDKAVLQLFGVIIAKKLYNEKPKYIAIAAKSSNQFLSQFSKEILSFYKVN